MFDRAFFEGQFLDHVQQFCREKGIVAPVVDLLLDDGSVIRLRAIRKVREGWLALSAYGDGDDSRLILCPYFTIKRITFSTPSSPKDGVLSLPAKP